MSVCLCTCNGHSVTSSHYDMAIDNNGTLQEAFQFGDEDDTTWTLDGVSFAMDIQLNYYDAVPKLSLASQDGEIIIDDPVQRVIHLNVAPAAIQAALKPGTYVYDLMMIDPGNVKTLLMHGFITVEQGVTNV